MENNERALGSVEVLWVALPNSPEEDELDALVTCIYAFEEENDPITTPKLIEALRFRMEQQEKRAK